MKKTVGVCGNNRECGDQMDVMWGGKNKGYQESSGV